METQFAKWLREHDESHSAFALRRGLGKRLVARLAGVSREETAVRRWIYPPLAAISDETGIPVDTLVREAGVAAKNPVAPRRYTRREERHDGKAAAQ